MRRTRAREIDMADDLFLAPPPRGRDAEPPGVSRRLTSGAKPGARQAVGDSSRGSSASASRGAPRLRLPGLLLYLLAQALLLLPELGRELGAEVLCLEHLANLDLGHPFHGIGAALDPLDRLFP